MKVRIFQTLLLLVAVSAGALACGGSDTAPNGMTANDILAMSRNASASINTSQLYTTATANFLGSQMTMDSFTAEDRLNRASYYSQNISLWYDAIEPNSEVYNFNNSLYVYSSLKPKWIKTESEVDFWDEESINDLFQEFDSNSLDVNYMGMETIGGIDCYKIGFKLNLASAEDIIEYFEFNMSELDKTSLSDLECISWIDEDTYYSLKASIAGDMVVENVHVSLNMIMTITNINQPVNIVLPEAAINATVISYSDYKSGNY